MMKYYVYLLASRRNGATYLGMTSDLVRRVYQHKSGFGDSFSNRYNIKRLVWYETHGTAESAITREKRIKKWKRAWKIELIEESNPGWSDLYEKIV